MVTSITIRDELPFGEVVHEIQLELKVADERLSLRDLIKNRVFEEVQLYNLSLPTHFKGLVQPTDTEASLNGYRMREPRKIKWETQFEQALAAFEHNGFMVIVDDQQVDDLDEMIQIRPNTQVSFLKLVPLVGG